MIAFLVYSHVFLGVCLASLAAQVMQISGSGLSWPLLVLIWGATVFLYNLHALIRLSEKRDFPRYQARYAWVQSNVGWVKILIGIGMIASAVGLLALPTRLWGLVGVLGGMSLAYSVPVFTPFFNTMPRLRDIPYVKFFVLVSVLTVTVVGLPAMLSLGGLKVLTWVRMGLFLAAITLPFDIRDLEFDRHQGLPTLATWLGEDRARQWALVALALSAVVAAFEFSALPFAKLMVMALGYGVTWAILMRVRTERSGLFYGVWVEGALLFQSLLILTLF